MMNIGTGVKFVNYSFYWISRSGLEFTFITSNMLKDYYDDYVNGSKWCVSWKLYITNR